MKLTPRLAGRAALPIAAAGAIGFALLTVQRPEPAIGAPAVPPPSPSASMESAVAAVGLIEPQSETIAVAAEVSGVVRSVHVRPGDRVEAGAPLFELDRRSTLAALEAARATLRVAEVEAKDAEARRGLFSNAGGEQAFSQDQLDRVAFASERAQANLAVARAEVRRLETELSRLVVRAPIGGEILRVDVRPGEFAAAGPSAEPLIAMGDTRRLHVRVQIDEEDIGRIGQGAAAEGSLRGEASRKVPLTFVRFEPQALPKRNLTGGAERVDTRVVEAVYSFDPAALPAFVGQQMDVFVAARPVTNAGS